MVARLELVGIRKTYPGVIANADVSLCVEPGEIHAVLGENGAGKSTLMKIIYGVVQPDAGEIRWNGEPVSVHDPRAARALGIAMVFQHFSLFDTLTVAENVWLGLERGLRLERVTERIGQVGASYGLEIDARRPVHALSMGERQRVEIVRALLARPKLLILDEPTSVLTPQAVEKLFDTLRTLAREGCSILYISHKLDDIRALCQRCTVLRAGRKTGEVTPAQETNASLSRLMIGDEPPRVARQSRELGELALELKQLRMASPRPFGTALHDLDLTLHCGEIVGVAGVSGNGQRELMAAISGEQLGAPPGSIRLFGSDVTGLGVRKRRALGLRSVPEERLGRGAVPSLSLADNVLLTRDDAIGPFGVLRTARMRELARSLIERFSVKASGPNAPAKSLSGGNLQKYIVGRELSAAPTVLVLAQPTWGVDVGAAAQIRRALLGLRDQGAALLVISEELEELFQIADRLVVIARGRLSPSLDTEQASVEQVGMWMSGLWGSEPRAANAQTGLLAHA